MLPEADQGRYILEARNSLGSHILTYMRRQAECSANTASPILPDCSPSKETKIEH
jgi:hypothetical protein